MVAPYKNSLIGLLYQLGWPDSGAEDLVDLVSGSEGSVSMLNGISALNIMASREGDTVMVLNAGVVA